MTQTVRPKLACPRFTWLLVGCLPLVACATAKSDHRSVVAPTSKSWARPLAHATVVAFDPVGNLLTGGVRQQRDGVLTEFSPEGDPLWTKRLASAGLLDVSGLAADAAGDFYATGAFERKLSVDDTSLEGGERPAIFVIKFRPDGAIAWAKAFAGAGYNAGRAIAADADGTIYLTGTYQHELSLGGESLQAYVFRDVFVASLDANGKHRFSQGLHIRGPVETTGRAIAVDAQAVYVAGVTETDLTFSATEPGASTPNALFVVRLTKNGNLLFRKLVTGPGPSKASGIASDPKYGFTVVGEFEGTVNVEGVTVKSAGRSDALVIHYDAKGNFSWLKRFGGTGWDRATGVVVGADGTSYVTAMVTDAVDLGDPDLGHGGEDALVAAFDVHGSLLWMRRYGDVGNDQASAIAKSRGAALAVAGTFAHSLKTGVGSLEGTGAPAGFALRFDAGTPPPIEATKIVISDDPAQQTAQAFAAAERGDVATLTQLVPARVQADSRGQGWPMVMKAAYKGKTEVIRYLCAHGADANAALPSGYTPLMQAVRFGYSDAATALVEGGAKVDVSDAKVGTALHVVVSEAKDALDIVRYLIARGAPLEAKDFRGRTPLLVAIETGNVDAAELLLNAQANASAVDNTGYSALGRAATKELAGLVNHLLERGADPNAASDHGWSAVTAAAQKGNTTIVAALLAKGGNPDGPLSPKPTARPITLAAQAGKTEVVELLLARGAGVNQTDNHGWTAAHHAAAAAKIDVLRVLKKHGANFALKNDKGESVADVASGQAKTFLRGD